MEGDILFLRNYVAVVIDKSGKKKRRFNSVEKQIHPRFLVAYELSGFPSQLSALKILLLN
jgi:hypothetical protein